MTSDLLDQRLRTAAETLHREVSVRSLPELPQQRSTTRRTVVMAFAAIAVLLIGLIVIGNRQDDLPPAGPDADLHWLLDGGTPTEVSGPGALPDGMGREGMRSIFGTEAGPDGPVISVYVSLQIDLPGSRPTDGGGTNFSERTIDGIRAVLADGPGGTRQAFAEYEGEWIPMSSRNVDDDELFDFASHLVVADDGTVQVVEGHGPEVDRLGAGSWWSMTPALWAGFGRQGIVPGVVTVSYSQPSVQLIITRAFDAQLAQWSLGGDVTASDVDGIRVWDLQLDGSRSHEVAWQRDSHLFFMQAPLEVDLVALVPDVRPATPSEWAAMPGGTEQSDPSGSVAPAGTELPVGTVSVDGDAPAATDPPPEVSAVTGDVDLTWTVTDEHPNDLTMSVVLPNGDASRVEVALVAGTYRIGTSSIDSSGSTQGEWDDDSPEVFQAQFPGFQLLTRDPDVAFVRVRLADGARITLPLVRLAGHPGVGVAVLALENQFVSADLLDADRNVLRSIGDD